MVYIVRQYVLSIFAVVFLAGAAFVHFRGGKVEFNVLAVVATAAATLGGIRMYFLLKPELARLKEERKRENDRLFGESCSEIAEMMSYLSVADFSVFITCHRMLGRGEESYGFLTGSGSPIHNILVAMTDVRCARPVEMKRLHPSTEFSTARYELTGLGKALLPLFLKDAATRRVKRDRGRC